MSVLYSKTSKDCARVITRSYSTSFSLAISMLRPQLRDAIYSIYGYVRSADEIVDTFHEHDKKALLHQFRVHTNQALAQGISINPILHAYQEVARKYSIPQSLTDAFLDSMETDLETSTHGLDSYNEYIYGSAEVVGLMCLHVFVEGDKQKYKELEPSARSLGAAFQKVNFLRDIQSDYEERSRIYFPNLSWSTFDSSAKAAIEEDIEADFTHAFEGIKRLPLSARFGVYLAYTYYYKLFCKIKRSTSEQIQLSRVRISNNRKMSLLLQTYVQNALGLL